MKVVPLFSDFFICCENGNSWVQQEIIVSSCIVYNMSIDYFTEESILDRVLMWWFRPEIECQASKHPSVLSKCISSPTSGLFANLRLHPTRVKSSVHSFILGSGQLVFSRPATEDNCDIKIGKQTSLFQKWGGIIVSLLKPFLQNGILRAFHHSEGGF